METQTHKNLNELQKCTGCPWCFQVHFLSCSCRTATCPAATFRRQTCGAPTWRVPSLRRCLRLYTCLRACGEPVFHNHVHSQCHTDHWMPNFFFFSALGPKKWVSHKIKTCCSYSEASSQAVAPLRSALTSLNPVWALCSLSCCWAVWCCCGKLLPPGACHAWLTVMLGRVDRVRNIHLNTRTRWIPVRCSVSCRGFNVVAAHNVSFISAFSDTSEVLMFAVFLNFIYLFFVNVTQVCGWGLCI